MTCLEGCSLGFSAGEALTRCPASVAVAGIFTDDLTLEWDCRAYEDTHKTIATRTSNGLKDRKNRRMVRSIDTNETPPSFDFVWHPKLFSEKGDFRIAQADWRPPLLGLDFVLYAVFGSTKLAK